MHRFVIVVLVGLAVLGLLVPTASAAAGTVVLPGEACGNLVEHLQGLETATNAVRTNPGEAAENAVMLQCLPS